MKNNAVLFGIIGLLAGVVLTYLVVNNSQTGMMGATRSDHMGGMMKNSDTMMGTHGSSMTMDDMTNALKGKTGDDFDKAFIEMMIDHHQGAIDMAKEAQTSAKHEEIKKLSEDIITAQQKEIDEMRQWQKAWGYSQ